MQGEVDAEGAASDFDLNSLIEGDVDDDDFGDQFTISKEDTEESKTPVVSYFEPLKVGDPYNIELHIDLYAKVQLTTSCAESYGSH